MLETILMYLADHWYAMGSGLALGTSIGTLIVVVRHCRAQQRVVIELVDDYAALMVGDGAPQRHDEPQPDTDEL